MKELGSEVAGGRGDSQQIQPKSKTQLSRTERLVSEQPSGLLTQEINKRVLLECESINSRTGRPVNASSFSQSCVPVSLERVEKDKDADHVRTGRPVESEQPIGLFTQREETDIDFRVSGIATCSCETSRKLPCSRTREEDREPSSSTSTSSRLAAKKRRQQIQ